MIVFTEQKSNKTNFLKYSYLKFNTDFQSSLKMNPDGWHNSTAQMIILQFITDCRKWSIS